MAAELGFDDARFWRYPDVHRSMAVISGGTGHHRSPFGGIGDVEASLGVDVGRTDIDVYSARDYQTLDGFETEGPDPDVRSWTTRPGARGDLGLVHDGGPAMTILPPEMPYAEVRASVPKRLEFIEWAGHKPSPPSLRRRVRRRKRPRPGRPGPNQQTNTELGRGLASPGRGGWPAPTHASVSRRGRSPPEELYSGPQRFTPNPDPTENCSRSKRECSARPRARDSVVGLPNR